MRFYASLIWAELKRGFQLHVRYPVQTLTEIVSISLFFFGLLAGLRALGGGSPEDFRTAAGEKLVGFLTMFVALSALQAVSHLVADDAMVGTLEQIYLSPVGITRISIIRDFAELVVFVPLLAVLGIVISLITGVRFHLPWGTIAVLTLVMRFGMLGLGLALGGLTLAVKRTGPIVNLISMAIFGISMVPYRAYKGVLEAIAGRFPYTRALSLLQDAMVRGKTLSSMAASGQLLELFLASLAFFLVGVAVLEWADRYARRKGLVGGY